MLEYLTQLSRIALRPHPAATDVTEACGIVRAATGAEEAYVVRAGDPQFIRLGDAGDPAQYEIKQRGYWIIWRELATNEAILAIRFTVADRLVMSGAVMDDASPGTHIASLLTAEESNSEMLVLRGPWPEGFSTERRTFLEAARPMLSLLVANALDASKQERQRRQLGALTEVARAFSEASTMDKSLAAVATALAKISGFDWALVVLATEDGSTVLDSALNLARHSNTEIANRRAPYGPDLSRLLMDKRAPLLRPNVFDPACGATEEELAYFERAHILSTATFPMLFQERFLGFVRFSASVRRTFDADEVAFLSDLVAQASTTLTGIRLYQELEEASRVQHFLARSDALTGLPNRLYIEEVMRAECARAERNSEPVCVVMVDLDHFKGINDTIGHGAGDRALRHVAAVARESCRDSDFAGRWGGDEFIFILPATPLEGGLAFAERFGARLAETPFVPADTGAEWPLAASAGVAEASLAGYPHADAVFKLADTAMYAAKAAGRNRVRAAGRQALAA